MKTIKQIADEMGLDKQRVYRYIKKNRINEAHQEHDTKYYNEAAETLIKEHFSKITASSEAHQSTSNDALYEALLKQLDIKDKQIEILQNSNRELTQALENTTASLSAAQALHAGTIKTQITDNQRTEVLADVPKKSFFDKFFKKA